MNNALEITSLCKEFKEFSLSNVSFNLPEGYIMGLIGSNGSGKTTVLKLILNMLKKSSGEIKVFSLDHIKHEEDIKQNIGVVFDQTYMVDNWTLFDVERAVKGFYKKWDSGKYHKLIKDFNLTAGKRLKDLSRGMKVKVMIAIALSHDARLLILDEPTSSLDPVGRDELLDILGTYILKEDKSVLFSTHLTADLEKIADYITFLNNGRIVYSGTKDELLENYVILKGDKKEITANQKRILTGYREFNTGFEGMVQYNNFTGFSPRIISEPASLDDIIIFMNRRERMA
ncbi:MAG TPA: ABC transporter ATP-binding protein [Clostridia bacterium]|nr:ABC transporter ATP-binding protein [Clostridia bacterium]